MGYRHDRDSLLAEAVAAAYEDGVGSLTFGRLARRLGIADRTVVYYFPTKDQLVSDVMDAISLDLLVQLEAAFGDRRRAPEELVRAAWPIITDPDARAVFGVFLEVVGQAAAGVEPYATIARNLMSGWLDWVATLVEAPEGGERAVAAGVIARIEGLMVLHVVVGPDAAEAAHDALLG